MPFEQQTFHIIAGGSFFLTLAIIHLYRLRLNEIRQVGNQLLRQQHHGVPGAVAVAFGVYAVHRSFLGGGLAVNHGAGDDGMQDGDGAFAERESGFTQLVGDQFGVDDAIHFIDDAAQGADRGAEPGHRFESLDYGDGAAHEFTGGEDFRRNRGEHEVGGGHGGVLQRPGRALGVDKHEIVLIVEVTENVFQPHPAVRGVANPVAQLAVRIVREDDIQVIDSGLADSVVCGEIDQKMLQAELRALCDGVITGEGGLRAASTSNTQ